MSIERIIDINLNSADRETKTAVIDVQNIAYVGMHIKENSGNHTGSIWRMYCSPDKINWFKTDQVTNAQVNSIDAAFVFNCNGTAFVRFQLDATSAEASTEDITLIV